MGYVMAVSPRSKEFITAPCSALVTTEQVITGFGISSLPTRSRRMLKNQREPIRQLLR